MERTEMVEKVKELNERLYDLSMDVTRFARMWRHYKYTDSSICEEDVTHSYHKMMSKLFHNYRSLDKLEVLSKDAGNNLSDMTVKELGDRCNTIRDFIRIINQNNTLIKPESFWGNVTLDLVEKVIEGSESSYPKGSYYEDRMNIKAAVCRDVMYEYMARDYANDSESNVVEVLYDKLTEMNKYNLAHPDTPMVWQDSFGGMYI